MKIFFGIKFGHVMKLFLGATKYFNSLNKVKNWAKSHTAANKIWFFKNNIVKDSLENSTNFIRLVSVL